MNAEKIIAQAEADAAARYIGNSVADGATRISYVNGILCANLRKACQLFEPFRDPHYLYEDMEIDEIGTVTVGGELDDGFDVHMDGVTVREVWCNGRDIYEVLRNEVIADLTERLTTLIDKQRSKSQEAA